MGFYLNKVYIKMNYPCLILLTLVSWTHSLSLQFAATQSPGQLHYGSSTIRATCDETKKCAINTSSRSRCERMGCCFLNNQCYSKKYFIMNQETSDDATYCKGKPTGIYTIKIGGSELEVLCENDVDGGGWLVLQRRYDGSVNFARSWNEYATGFGSPNSELWMGLEHVHTLTKDHNCELRVEVENYSGKKGYDKYSGFKISSSEDKYRLSLDTASHSGDAGDGMSSHNGMMFSTMDQDNDLSGNDCSNMWGQAGNWYGACYEKGQNLNGIFSNGYSFANMRWLPWGTGSLSIIKTSRIMFRAVD